MVMLFLVKSGREQVGSLHAVYQFSDVVRHLLQPGERLSLPAVLDQPENAVFLAQFYASVASRRIAVVESALTSTTAPPSSSTATAADNSVSALAASAVKLLQALAPHWEHVANLLLSSDRRASSRFATTTGGADGDGEGDGSEFPESESAMDVEEDSSPPAAGESTSGGGGSGGKGTAGRVHVEFLLLHRSLIAVVIISRQAVAVSVSPAPLIEMVQNQDASLQKLIAHRVRAHAVMLRLSQCLTVGMIAHLTSKSRGELGRSSKAPARLSENALVRTAISLLDVPYSERNPACKIVTVGMLRFVKYAALLAAEVNNILFIAIVSVVAQAEDLCCHSTKLKHSLCMLNRNFIG